MKKTGIIYFSLITNLVFNTAFAENRCLEMIDKHLHENRLNLSYCQLTSADMPVINAFLANHPNIYSLNLKQNQLGDAGIASLVENTQLITLNIENNGITAEGAKLLAKNRSIQQLNIRENEIGDEGAIVLANNTTLQSLDIAFINAGDAAAAAFASNNSLKKLDLYANHIQNAGAILLAKNTSIVSLSVSGNDDISDEGVLALAHKPNLTELKLARLWPFKQLERVDKSKS